MRWADTPEITTFRLHGSECMGLIAPSLVTVFAVAAVYLWQAAPTRWPLLLAWARVLGLTSFADPAATWQQLLPAAVQLAAMLVLLPLLSFRLAAGGGNGRAPRLASGASWPSSERAPLLQHDQQQQAQVQQQQAAQAAMPMSPRRWSAPALTLAQLLYLLLLDTAEVLGREPAVVAAVLCAAALVRPSLLSGAMLLWGLGALLARPVAAGLRRSSRALTAALLVSLRVHACCKPADWVGAVRSRMAAQLVAHLCSIALCRCGS